MTDKGAVLLLTFIIMVTLIAITIGFLYVTATKLRGTGYDAASSKALWVAEAGIQNVLYQLKNDSDYRDSPTTVTGSVGEGSYSVAVSKDVVTYTITSTGTVSVLNRKITQTAVVSVVPEAFNYVQHAADDIKFKNAENGTITGNISAGNEVKNLDTDEITVNGTITESSTVINPTLDTDSYAAIADNTVSGNKTFEAGQTYTGIWYVDGKATIEDNVTINGSIIATGDIKLENSEGVTINPTSPYPALVSDKNVKGKKLKDSTITGLIYAAKDVKFNKSENNIFNGTMIAGKKIDMEKAKDFTITFDSDILSNPPPFFSGGETVTVAPQKDWDEIAL